MTLAQARRRYPLVPAEVLKWAVQNIDDSKALERCLRRVEQTKRMQIKYAKR